MNKIKNRKILRLLLFFRKKLGITKDKFVYDSPQQEKAVRIAKRLISDEESELLLDPLSDKYYLRKKNIFVVISAMHINIINGKYNYDIVINDKIHSKLVQVFLHKLSQRRTEMENEIVGKVETILGSILKDITK
jgi:hypothetical protein